MIIFVTAYLPQKAAWPFNLSLNEKTEKKPNKTIKRKCLIIIPWRLIFLCLIEKNTTEMCFNKWLIHVSDSKTVIYAGQSPHKDTVNDKFAVSFSHKGMPDEKPV